MAAEPEMWNAIIERLEGMRDWHKEQLAPLEAGETRLGHAGADTGFRWVDITKLRIEQERDAIISLECAIARLMVERENRA